jgi:hypothetical protein
MVHTPYITGVTPDQLLPVMRCDADLYPTYVLIQNQVQKLHLRLFCAELHIVVMPFLSCMIEVVECH